MKCRTGTHSAVDVSRALWQGVVLLGCPQWPQQAKADGRFPKRNADGMHGYLADLKLRLVELFGGESATEMRKSTPVALVMSRRKIRRLPSDTPANRLLVEASSSLS